MGIIEARGLARTFKSRKRTVEAVRGVDLTVGAGEVVGFLGPNGAGKTTTLRMLTTLLQPTAGTATVAGRIRRLTRVVFWCACALWYTQPRKDRGRFGLRGRLGAL